MPKPIDSLEQITIIRTQWKGFKPKHYWAAFMHSIKDIPDFVGANAELEKKFFLENKDAYTFGLGDTPGVALRNMYEKHFRGHVQDI